MDRIREMLDRISELSSEEIEELENSIVSEFDSIADADPTREVVDQMTELADATDVLRAERSRRDSEAAELSAARDAATARIRGSEPETGEELSEDDVEAVEADEEIDPVTGKKKKKVPAEELPADFSVNEPTEVVPAEGSELAVEQPAVQPEEIKENPVVGQTDAEVFEKSAGEPEVVEATEEAVEDAAEKAEAAAEEAAKPEVEEAEEVSEESEASAEDTDTESDPEEPVTAAADTSDLVVEVPEDRGLATPKVAASVAITAGADLPGIAPGSRLTSMRQVAQGIIDRRKGMGRTTGGDGEQSLVASFTTTYPEDRVLSAHDTDGNLKKIEDVVSGQAIVAAGGLCAPVEVRYDVFGFNEELGRPVRDDLAVFNADRGGVRFVTPPTMADLNGAVSLWTLQDDIDAATDGAPDPVKPCIRVECGDEVVVYIDAIPLCLTFGNMGARAYPELVERHIQLGMVWHARYSEVRLLTRIGALSTSVSATGALGAARDFFRQVEVAAAAYRNRYRIAYDTPLRVILPEWFKNALRADLTLQLPGDGQDVTFNLSEAQIDGWFRTRNINVTWSYDGETGQIFGAQAAGALLDFPENVIWYLFAEGTFLFLDGGNLDLGLVRDSTLNGTNDYKIFLETFEGVAKVGIESLRVTSELLIAGASAATVATTV